LRQSSKQKTWSNVRFRRSLRQGREGGPNQRGARWGKMAKWVGETTVCLYARKGPGTQKVENKPQKS